MSIVGEEFLWNNFPKTYRAEDGRIYKRNNAYTSLDEAYKAIDHLRYGTNIMALAIEKRVKGKTYWVIYFRE